MRSQEFSGRTVDEAIFHGLHEMGVDISDVIVETVTAGSKGIFGIGSKLAVVRLTEREAPAVPAEPVPAAAREERAPRREKNDRPRRDRRDGDRRDKREREPEVVEETYDYSEELAKDLPAAIFLKELLSKMGVEAKVLACNTDNGLRLRMDANEMGLLIGRRGETLDALQYIVSLYVNKGQKEYTRVTLDTEGYRSRREETLCRLARKTATQVRQTGRSVAMEPMNPYERRILHSALQNFRGVTTYSEGEEPERRVIIAPDR